MSAVQVLPDRVQVHWADGRLSPAATALLAPYLLGAWINSRLWTLRQPKPSQVVRAMHVGFLLLLGFGIAAGYSLADSTTLYGGLRQAQLKDSSAKDNVVAVGIKHAF